MSGKVATMRDAVAELVREEDDPVLVADPAEARQEVGVGDDIAALALDRLDDHGGERVGRCQPLEHPVLELVEPGAPEGHVVDARQERPEAIVVLGLGGGEADRAIGATVEGAEEREQVRAAGVVPGELDRGLDRLRAGVPEEDAGRPADRRDPRHLGRGLGVDRKVEVRGAEVDELGRLALDRGDDAGVGVAGGRDRDPRREVQEQVAVDVLDRRAAPADGDDRVRARKAGRRPAMVELDVGPRLGTGDLRDQARDRPPVRSAVRHGRLLDAHGAPPRRSSGAADRRCVPGRCIEPMQAG